MAAFVIMTLILALSFLQTLTDIAATPAGTTFPFVHNWVEDYYVYLMYLRQGWEGASLATSWMTPEQAAPQLVNTGYLLAGKLARVLGVGLGEMYTLGRLSGGIMLLLASYGLAFAVYPKSSIKQLISLLLIGFTGFWWGWSDGGPTLPSLVAQWTELDPLVRFSFVPHHLFAKAFMVMAFLLLLGDKERVRDIAAIGILVFLAGFASPVTLATILPTLGMWLVLRLFHDRFDPGRWREYLPTIAGLIVAGVLIFYFRSLSYGVFPWNSYPAWEETVRYPVTVRSYLESLGPVFMFFLIGMVALWKRLNRSWMFLSAWAGSGWLAVVATHLPTPTSNIRFLEGYQFLPIAIGAVAGIECITKKRGIKLLLVITLIVYSFFGIVASMRTHQAYLSGDRWDERIFIPNDRIAALSYLSKQFPAESVIVAPLRWNLVLPAFAGLRVIAAHPLFTDQYADRVATLAAFYSGTSPEAMRAYLQKNRASAILVDGAYKGIDRLVAAGDISLLWQRGSIAIYVANQPRVNMVR